MSVVAFIYYSTVPCHQDAEEAYTLRLKAHYRQTVTDCIKKNITNNEVQWWGAGNPYTIC